jgi:hypothetical protein
MSQEPTLQIPPGYERWIRYGANWTLLISPYLILYFVLIFAIGGASIGSTNIRATLELAGKSPFVFGTTVMLDGFFHVLFFPTVVTLFSALRLRWPVRASLLLVFGTWQMLMGFTKALSSWFTFTHLGAAYVTGDTALRATLLTVATGEYGLRDSLGVLAIWVSVSLLPLVLGFPRGALAGLDYGPGDSQSGPGLLAGGASVFALVVAVGALAQASTGCAKFAEHPFKALR